MEREHREEPLIPSFFKGSWDVVKLGRWAGVFVFLSALALAVWETFIFVLLNNSDPTPDLIQVQLFFSGAWRTLVQLGSLGVVIILLAELVDRVSEYDEEREG
jgi:hypothetical protein